MDNQFTVPKRKQLFRYLDGLLDKYDPDAVGINEIIYDDKLKSSHLLDYFQKRGYHTHFVPFSPKTDRLLVGSGLMTKLRPSQIIEHSLGVDLPAKRRGYEGHDIKTIEAVLPLGANNREVRLIVTYLAHLIPPNWVVHQQHYRQLRKLLSEHRFSKDFIMVGDFNEPKYHPNILRLSRHFKRKTGTLLAPTWRWRGRRLYMARANYDNIMWSNDESLRLEEFEVLGEHPSDHAPLYAKFTLK